LACHAAIAASLSQYETVIPGTDSIPKNPGCSAANSTIRAAISAYPASSPVRIDEKMTA
jgi:hypothetical protein